MHVQTIGQKRHKNVGLDAALPFVKDRPQAQIVFEIFEGSFHLRQLNVKPTSAPALRTQISQQTNYVQDHPPRI